MNITSLLAKTSVDGECTRKNAYGIVCFYGDSPTPSGEVLERYSIFFRNGSCCICEVREDGFLQFRQSHAISCWSWFGRLILGLNTDWNSQKSLFRVSRLGRVRPALVKRTSQPTNHFQSPLSFFTPVFPTQPKERFWRL